MGLDFVFQRSGGSRARKPSAFTRRAQHQQIAVPDADGIQPQALTFGFIGGVSLVQLVQHVVEPALYANVQIVYARFFQRLQVFIRNSCGDLSLQRPLVPAERGHPIHVAMLDFIFQRGDDLAFAL